MRYSESLIDEIRNNNDIVDIISQYVTLKKRGRNFIGLCPFHKEKTPSFCVSPDKQIFYCFGCNTGGDVIKFISKIENISFKESIEFLAEKAGIVLPKLGNEDSKKQALREKVYEINEVVAEFYHNKLYEPIAKPAQEYVKKRKLDNRTLKNFKIGYSPNGNVVYKILKEKGYSEEEILASNLVKKMNNGYVDLFRNRLMFPICDIRNRVIAFGGRVLDNSLPKYINSPDTIVYNKGRNLYGLNVARKSDLQKIVIVEGYMDTISLHQRGIPNVVASLGTALTEAQGRLLRKYSEKVIISYDSDGAGQAATLRGLEILNSLGCDVRILQIEDAKDPDEYVIKYGSGRFNLLVEDAISLIEFKAKMMKKDLNLENANDKIKFLKEIAKLLKTVNSKIEQEIYLDKICKEYNISKEAIYAEINKENKSKIGERVLDKPKVVIKNEKDKISAVLQERENTIVFMLINGQWEVYKQISSRVLPTDFSVEANKKIVEVLYKKFEEENSDLNNVLDLFLDDEEATSKITEIFAKGYEVKDDKKAIDNIINIYEKEKLTLKRDEIIQSLKEGKKSIEETEKLEKELKEITTKLTQIK